MSRQRIDDGQPSHALIKSMIGVRHRLSGFYDPAGADSSRLLKYRSRGRDREEARQSEVGRNLGVSAASQVLQDLFAEFDSYVLGLAGQRIIEHRAVRADDRLHSDVFVESHQRLDSVDSFDVRVVFTDVIGAMVFTCFLTFTGTLDASVGDTDAPAEQIASENETPGIAVSS